MKHKKRKKIIMTHSYGNKETIYFYRPADTSKKWYQRRCWYPPCNSVFWSDNPFVRYCCDEHRNWHLNGDDNAVGEDWVNYRAGKRSSRSVIHGLK